MQTSADIGYTVYGNIFVYYWIADGTESSHMHSEEDESYNRGYEWYVMTEAKKVDLFVLIKTS